MLDPIISGYFNFVGTVVGHFRQKSGFTSIAILFLSSRFSGKDEKISYWLASFLLALYYYTSVNPLFSWRWQHFWLLSILALYFPVVWWSVKFLEFISPAVHFQSRSILCAPQDIFSDTTTPDTWDNTVFWNKKSPGSIYNYCLFYPSLASNLIYS